MTSSTGFARGEDDVVAGMFAAAGDDDLRRLVGRGRFRAEIFSAMASRNSGMPAAGRVFGEPGGERLGAGVLDVLRRVEVRLARAEPHDILAGGLHGLGFGVDCQRERGRKGGGAL